MDIFSGWHLLILLLVVVIVFGTSKISKIGPDLGKAVRGFKSALNGDDEDKPQAKAAAQTEKLQADPSSAKAEAAQKAQSESSESK